MAAGRCPRCDAPRAADQHYCVDCGLRLPPTEGALPALRRRWLRSFEWYPGDWFWPALLALAVATLGAAGAVALKERDRGNGGTTFEAAPLSAAPASAPARSPTAITTLPAFPAPPAEPRPSGETEWPPDTSGWTVVLVSLPRAVGVDAARERAKRAARTGLSEAGYLVSDRFASLHPGYLVVFSGVYDTRAEAEAAVPTARSKGFGGAYARPIAP